MKELSYTQRALKGEVASDRVECSLILSLVNMSLKDAILQLLSDSKVVRQLFADKEVVQKLESVGIQVTVYELHEPAPGAKKSSGLGKTLCGRDRSMRNRLVTCKKCLAKIEKIAETKASEAHFAMLDKIMRKANR